MGDKGKTKKQLLEEIQLLRQEIARLNNLNTRQQLPAVLAGTVETQIGELGDLLTQILFEADLQGNVLYSNTAGIDVTGYTKEDLKKGINLFQLFPESDRPRVHGDIEKVLRGEEFYDHEYTLLRKDGTTFPTMIYASPIIKAGRPFGIRGIAIDLSERVEAETQLQTLSSVVEQSESSIAIISQQGDVEYANPIFLARNNLDPKKIIGKPWRSFVSQQSSLRHQVKDIHDTVLMKGETWRGEVVDKTKDGKLTWREAKIFPIKDDKGKMIHSVYMSEDITHRKLAEEALKGSQQRLLRHVQRTPLGVIEWNLNFEVTEWNPAAERIFGFSREEALGRHAADIIVPADVRKHVDRIWQALLKKKGGQRSTNENVTKQGSTILCEWYNTPLVDTNNHIVGVASLVQDVTQQMKAEEDLKKSEAEYREMFELSPQAVVMLDGEGTLLDANKKVYDLFGFPREEIIGKNFINLPYLPEESRAKAIESFRKRIKGNNLPGYEIIVLTKNGERRVGRITGTLIRDQKGKIKRTLVMISDVTEQRWMENLTRQQRDLALSLSVSTNLQEAFSRCVDTALAVSSMDCSGIYLVGQDSGNLDLVYHQGLSPGFVKATRQYFEDDPYTLIVMAGKPLYTVNSDLIMPAGKPVKKKESLRALALIPIQYQKEVIACLNVGSHGFDEISASVRSALETIATQMGEVIYRIRVEAAIRSSEERFRTLQENIPLGVFRTTPGGKILFANPAMVEMLGFDSMADILLLSAGDFYVVPQQREKMLEQLRKQQAVIDFDVQFKRRDGSTFWASLNIKAMFDENGEITHLDGILKDISERKQFAETMMRAKEEWERTFDTVPELIFILDEKNIIRRLNRALAERLGIEPNKLVGRLCHEVFHGTDKPPSFCPHVRVIAEGREYSVEVYEENLSGDFIITISPWYDAAGKMVGTVHTAVDISERKWAENLLEKQRDLARALSVTSSLKEALSLFLKTAIEVSGMDAGGVYLLDNDTGGLDLIHSQGLSRKFIQSVARYAPDSPNARLVMAGKPVYQDYAQLIQSIEDPISQNDDLRALAVLPVLYQGEVVACLNITSHTVDQISTSASHALETLATNMGEVIIRVRAEEKLKSTTEQLQALASHLQNVREGERIQIARELHDELSSMLTVLKMGLVRISDQLIQKETNEFRGIIKKTQSMEEMINKSVALVRRMITRLRPAILDDLGLIAAIEWLVEEFQEDSGIKCVLDANLEKLELPADESTAIFRILQEILINTARHAAATEISINLEKTKESFLLRIEDNGQGIKPQDGHKKKSFGILGIRERANLYGWNFSIEGAEGKGTRINLTVPMEK